MLLDTMFGMLRLEFVYLRRDELHGGSRNEFLRSALSSEQSDEAQSVGTALERSLGKNPANWPAGAQTRIADTDLSIAIVRVGLPSERALVVAGSRRLDFPDPSEKLLLNLAANQAAIALRQVRRLDEQSSVARELEERVAWRTRDLAAANEELRQEIAQRHLVETALRDSERNSNLVIGTIPGLIATMTPTGEIDSVNSQVLQYCGGTLEDVRRWASNDTVHPSDLPNVVGLFTRAIALGEPYDFEARIRRHDASYRWFQVRGLPVRDGTNQILRWYALLTDIDERKSTEEALRQSEARLAEAERDLHQIIDNIPVMVTIFDADGKRLYVNKQVREYTGRTDSEDWAATVHPDDVELLAQKLRNAAASGQAFELEYRVLGRDEAYRWFLRRHVPLRDETGKVTRWFGASYDIDERWRAEEALRQSEARLVQAEHEVRLTLDSIPTITWRADPSGYIQQLNKQWFEYTGTTVEQIRGWRWKLCVHPEDLERLDDIGRAYVASGIPIDGEARLKRFDGEYRWFLFRPSPVRDDAGSIIGWYGSITDIEDRKQAEANLVKAEYELRRMLDEIPTLIVRGATNGYIQYLNKQWFEYTGSTPETARGFRWQQSLHPDDKDRLVEFGARFVATAQPGDCEARLRRFDGVYRWFLFRPAPARDEAGNFIGWYGTVTDIEDRKRAETQLAAEKQLLEMVASGRPLRDVLSTLCKSVEEAALGCLCDVHMIDWTSQTFQYGVAPSLPDSYTAPIAGLPVRPELVPCGIAAHEKIQVISEDFESDPRWCTSPVRAHVLEHGIRSVWSVPILSKEGDVLGTFCVYQRQPAKPSRYHEELIAHATRLASIAIGRSLAETALRRSEAFLAQAQRISLTGSFSWRVDTDEIRFSDELHRIFEFEPSAVVTLDLIAQRVHPDDLPMLAEKQAQIRSGLDNPQYEIRLRMPDGRLKYTRVFGRVVRHENDRLECLGAFQDVTERWLGEEALDTARSELAHVTRVMSLSALTVSIAHEVNQPLAGIITNANTCLRMLAADPPNVDVARETVRRTIRDGNRAADVIARLRALFSKTGSASEILDLNDATREVLALVLGDLLRNRVILRVEVDDDRPLLVTGDRVQLQQVILNLVRNASDAMSEVIDRPRTLQIRADLDQDQHTRLTVRDAGVGFAPQDAERLFAAFYTTKNGGMGIGLSLSRSIIESHGGRLWAEANDGPGATFSFSIPGQSASAGDEGAIWARPMAGTNDLMRNA